MNIILLKNLDNVGEKHSIVTVKPGFARNYLIPKGLALVANDTNLRRLEELKRKDLAQEQKSISFAESIVERLEGKVLRVGAKAGTSGKIFGSVTNIQIASAMKEQFNIDIDRKAITVPDDVKELGAYFAAIDLHKDVEVKVNFEVVEE